MKLTTAELEHLAKLSRLSVSDAEKEKFSTQLSSVLDYVGQLQKISIGQPSKVQEGLFNVARSDEARKMESKEAKKSVEAAPSHEENLVKTKAVF